MNWVVFAIATYFFLAAEAGLRPLFLASHVSPSFVLILAVFVGLMAPAHIVVWAMLVLGVLLDLLVSPIEGVYVIGPAALGYLLGAFVVIQVRGLVFRESLFSLSVMTLVIGIFVHLVIVFMFTVRGTGLFTGEPVPNWDVANQLFHRFLELVYSAAFAFPVGWLLYKTARLWDFPGKTRRERTA